MKRVTIILSVLVAVSMLLVACQPATPAPVTEPPAPVTEPAVTQAPIVTELPRNETIFVSGAAWGPASTWNPYQPGNLANTSGTVGLVYETLFGFDPLTGNFIPWLAKDGTWTNATTYDVTLRTGLTWSDGQPLTADDVVYSFELGKTDIAIWFHPLWSEQGLTSVTAVDATHVEFAFSDPIYQEFANQLYNIPIVPKHLWETRTAEDIDTGTNENPIGSGAYLYMATGADRNVWQRNDSWWGISVFGTPAPKYIVDIRVSSNNVALGMVLQGQLDLSNNFLPGVASLVDNGLVTTYFPGAPYMLAANTAYLALNTTVKPLDDPAFRKALAWAIDTPTIVSQAYANLVNVSSPGALLPALSQYDDAAVLTNLGFHYDQAAAKSMLAAAGYLDVNGDNFVENPDGSAISLKVTCPTGWTDWMAAINVIGSSAQAAGINLVAEPIAYGDWNTQALGGTFSTTLQNNTPLTNTPWTTYNALFAHPIVEKMQNGNIGRFTNQAMFDAVDALGKVEATDTAGMKAAVSTIQTLMLTDMPVIPLWYNGAWAQWPTATTAVWQGFSTSTSEKQAYPISWNGFWQTGGLQTLINISLVPPPAP